MDTIPMDNGMASPFGGVSDDPNTQPDMMPQQEPQQNYGADFDAGVEANEEEDPKKYIQQLTGKLSQSLRKYNENLPQPDAELSKYVAGMIIKQAIEGLSQEDVADIMDKVEKDDEEAMNQQQPTEDVPQAPQQGMDDETAGMPPMNETTASTVNPTKTDGKKAPSQIGKGGYSRKPYKTTA